MIFYTVVGSEIRGFVPAGQFLGDYCPFVADFVMEGVQIFLLLWAPFGTQDVLVQMVVIPMNRNKGKGYL